MQKVPLTGTHKYNPFLNYENPTNNPANGPTKGPANTFQIDKRLLFSPSRRNECLTNRSTNKVLQKLFGWMGHVICPVTLPGNLND